MKKIIVLIFIVAVNALFAYGQSMSTAEMEKAIMAKENMGWNLIKQKNFDEFAKAFAEDYQGVYGEGIMNRTNELNAIKTVTLDSLTLSDMKAVFPTKDTAIVTYKAAAKGMFMDKAFDETYNVSSVWAKRGGRWQIFLHTESKIQ